MASRSKLASHMELFEPEPAKPQPLRIIKRSQTIAGNSTSGGLFSGSPRGLSGSSNESFNVGSPPFGADRPLTVHKLRKKRGSVLEGALDPVPTVMAGNAIHDLIMKASGMIIFSLSSILNGAANMSCRSKNYYSR